MSSIDYKESSHKDQFLKMNSNKFEYDLYHEEDDIPGKVVRVKKYDNSSGEKWKIFVDGKNVSVLEDNKLSEEAKIFLRTLDGFNFLISEFKSQILNIEDLILKIDEKLNKKV